MPPLDLRLTRLVPGARARVAGIAALGVGSGALAVAQAFAVAALVVAIVRAGTGEAAALTPALALVATVLLGRAALAAAAESVAGRAGVLVSTALRDALAGRWLSRPADRRPAAAEATTVATLGIASVEPYVARFLPALVSAMVLPVLAVVTVAVVDWPSALVLVLTVPLLPVFAALIGAATERRTRRRWAAMSVVAGHFLDVVQGLPVLVGYGRATRQTETIRQVSETHRRATVATLRLAFLSAAALELLATISVAIVAVEIGLRLSVGSMDLQTGLTVILLAPEAYWPIRRVGAEYHAAADGLDALRRVLDELEQDQEHGGEVNAPTGHTAASHTAASHAAAGHTAASHTASRHASAVHARGVRYRYPQTDVDVLDAVDLEVLGPGLVLVTGASGSGKSTLLDLLAGVREPTAGTLQHPAAHLVTQRPLLVAGTLRENLALAAVGTDEEALTTALDAVGLASLVAVLPDGMETRLGDDGFGLSAGQRARLAIARATLSTAPLLALDEPTAHLDPTTAERVERLLERLARDRIVVVATHQPHRFAAAAHRIALSPRHARVLA